MTTGMSREAIFKTLQTYRQHDLDPHGGNVWAYVYDAGLSEAEAVGKEAYNMFANHNGLDFTVFPSLLQMEKDIVGDVAAMFRGHEPVEGTFTSGGTESIMLAVKAARDYARQQYPEVTEPEMILFDTTHAAFHKAAHYLGITPVVIPACRASYRGDPADIQQAINERTIMIAASSVNYSHGVSDPIAEIARLAEDADIWFHVDACIGGFLLYYFRELGEQVPAFDFTVPGVHSLSVDLHKYAYTLKGASVILYRNKQLRRYQYYAHTGWSGYPVINTTVQSTKSGGPLAACWAIMRYIGTDGYLALSKQVLQAKQELIRGFSDMPELQVAGQPEAGLVAVTSQDVDLLQIADDMRRRDWYLQVQPGMQDLEPTLHFTITPVSKGRVSELLRDLQAAVATAKLHPRTSMLQKAPHVLTPEVLQQPESVIPDILAAAGVKDGQLPQDMADINELLRLLPSELTEALFVQITNELFSLYDGASKRGNA